MGTAADAPPGRTDDGLPVKRGHKGTKGDAVKKAVLAVVAVVVAALSVMAGGALADGVQFGVNDNEGLFEKGAGPFFSTLTGVGMRNTTITIRWDPAAPGGFEQLAPGVTAQDFLPGAVAGA